MLDHSITGVHYACSRSEWNETQCEQRTTKSGAIVNVCACKSADYCNYRKWPQKNAKIYDNFYDDSTNEHSIIKSSSNRRSNGLLFNHFIFIIFIFFFFFSLFWNFQFNLNFYWTKFVWLKSVIQIFLSF